MDEHPIRVLLVEDNPGDARLIQETLRDVPTARFTWRHVERLDEAVRVVAQAPVDVVLLDLFLPDSTGLETFLTFHTVAPQVPVVLLSGLDDESVAIRVVQEGAQDYLVKGQVNGNALVRAIRSAEARAQLAREQAARQAAESANRTKDVFLSSAAHELKTPLATLKASAQLLARMMPANVPPHAPQLLEAINRQCDRLNRLVQDLLEVSRLALDQVELHRQVVDLGALVAGAVEQIRVTAPRHRLRWLGETGVLVEADPQRIEQVAANLLSNAVKFSPNGGDIEVALRLGKGDAVVSVRDHGVGIAKERQPQIFERFYRAHAGTAHDYGGMGVGLHLSRELVTRHGGRIWFESTQGAGSTFSFSLPAVGEDQQA